MRPSEFRRDEIAGEVLEAAGVSRDGFWKVEIYDLALDPSSGIVSAIYQFLNEGNETLGTALYSVESGRVRLYPCE